MDSHRYHGLDALRGTMMMLGIVLHAAFFYQASPPPHVPILLERNTSHAMDVLLHFIHAFRMPVFFLLAGFFMALLVERRGLRDACRNRAARVLAPLVAGMFTLVPLTLLFMLDFMLYLKYGSYRVIPDRDELVRYAEWARSTGLPEGIPLAHLWFLYYLLFFYALAPICRFVGERSQGVLAKWGASRHPMAALPLLAVLCAATLWPFPGGQAYGEFIFLKPVPSALVFYGTFFVIGYQVHYHRDVLRSLTRCVGWCAALGVALYPLALYLSHLEYGSPPPAQGIHLAAVLVHGLCTWSLSFAVIGAAMRWFDRDTPWISYISQSAYWVFLLHLPVVAIMGWVLVPHDVHALLKFLLVCVVTTLVCFATYHYWVRNTWLGAFLNGRRYERVWPWERQATPAAA